MKTVMSKIQMVNVKTQVATEFLKPDEILYRGIQGKNVSIKLQSGRIVTSKQSLKALEKEGY